MAESLNFLELPLALRIVWVIAGAALLYLPPGYAVQWLLVRPRALTLTRPEQLAVALGIGLALPPLLIELTHVLGLMWSGAATWTYIGVSLITLLVIAVQHWRTQQLHWPRPSWHEAVLLSLLLVSLVAKLFAVRELPAGLWGDSYHHTVITQLLVDNGGLFTSWQPYAPLTTFTYHFGFHANAAFLHWLVGIPVLQSVVQMGQVLGALTLVMAYLLTARLTHSRTAALWAAVFTGFVNLQPSFFVNWGRYTQLAGQVLLPLVLVAWLALLRARRWDARLILFTALMTAGLMLTHYIVTIFAALCLGVYLLALLGRVASWRQAAHVLGIAAVVTLMAGVFTLPWLMNTLGGYLLHNTSNFVNGTAQANHFDLPTSLPPITPFYLKPYLLVLAAIGLWQAWRQQIGSALLLAAWCLCLLFAILPSIVGLPGTGIVDFLTGYIGLYLFALPLAGYGVACLFEASVWRTLRRAPQLITTLQIALIAGVSLWGTAWQINVVDLQYQLLTPADARAMLWIRSNTPADAHFLVNGFPAYSGALIAGNDGGWWLPFLTGRPSTLPPLTYGTEKGVTDRAEIADSTVRVWRKLRKKANSDLSATEIDLTQPDALALLKQAGVTHVYIGAHSNPARQISDHVAENTLVRSSQFRLVYAKDGVKIFQLVE